MGIFARARAHYSWSDEEFRNYVVTAIVLAITFSIPRFFEREYSLITWISVFILYLIVVLILLYAILGFQKVLALSMGYRLEFRMSIILLGIGLYLAYMLEPLVPTIITPWLFIGTFYAHHHERLRLGQFRYWRNHGDLAKIVAGGALVSVLGVLLFKLIYYASGAELARDLLLLSWWLGVGMLLPLPWNQGLDLFKTSRMGWAFVFTFVFFYGFLALIGGVGGVILAVVLAALATWLYTRAFEKS
ncbi:MAG: hypothetical protein ABIA93_02540 [Candidatus Woesearchaeota archaeon]